MKLSYGAVLEKSPGSNAAGLELFVPLVKEHFTGGIPDAFQLVAHINDSITRHFELQEASIYPVTPSGAVDIDFEQHGRVCEPEPKNGSVTIAFQGLRDSARYRVRLVLIPLNKDYLRDIGNESHSEKKKEILSAYETRAKNTLDTLLTQGGINLELK